ncbi:MAG: hypothetical protein R2764_11355 [Bacteroidales bacterium]
MKNNKVILLLSFSTLLFGYLSAQVFEVKSPLMQEISIRILESNNFLLQSILIFLVVLIFGYTAKLFYEHKYRKE